MPSPPSPCATPAATSSYHARCCSSAPTTRSRGCLPPPAAGPRRPRRRASRRRRHGPACAWTKPTSARTRRMACATMGVTAPPCVDIERPHTKGSARVAASRRQQRQGRPGLAPYCGQPASRPNQPGLLGSSFRHRCRLVRVPIRLRLLRLHCVCCGDAHVCWLLPHALRWPGGAPEADRR